MVQKEGQAAAGGASLPRRLCLSSSWSSGSILAVLGECGSQGANGSIDITLERLGCIYCLMR